VKEQRDISTAPRDGTMIVVGGPDDAWFVMRWNSRGYNAVFQPDAVGIWESPDGTFTWSEQGGYGPMYWRPA
jgi:hypothetical protein